MTPRVLSPFALGPIALAPSGLTVNYDSDGTAPVDPRVVARLSQTLDSVVLTSTAIVTAHIDASFAQTLDDVTLSATAEVETPAPPAGEVVRFAMVAADYDNTDASWRSGDGGSNYFGAFVAIPSATVGDHAWYFTHDGLGWNPQPYNASLTGYTMHAVDLAAGDLADTAVATALRAAISGEALYDTVGGSGVNVEVTDDIDAAGAFTGAGSGLGTSATWGDQNEDETNIGGVLTAAILGHATFTDGPAIVFGLGVRVDPAGDPVRLALYTGGSAATGGSGLVQTADLDDTAVFCEATVVGSGIGWQWTPLPPAQVDELADSTSVQLVMKAEATSTRGTFRSTGNPGTSDMTNQQIALVAASAVDPDPAVAYPSTLEGADIDASFSVIPQLAFAYRRTPHRGDAGGITVTDIT